MSSPATSILRKPRGRVTANGTELRFSNFEVTQSANHQSDTFQVELPLFDAKAPYDWVWWADQTDVEIEIFIGFEQDGGSVGSWTSLIVGPLDAVAMAPLAYGAYAQSGHNTKASVGYGTPVKNENGPAHPAGAVITLRGRDYSGQLQDSLYSQQLTGNNLTAKTVIPQIVQRVPQLSVDMGDASDNIESDYNAIGGRLFLNRPAWDVITALADHEGFQARVQGRQVKVQPRQAPDTSNPYQLFYKAAQGGSANAAPQPVQSNCKTLRLARAINIGKGVDVFVQSYDNATGARPSRKQSSARSSRRSSRSSSGQSQGVVTHTFNRHGMTPEQAQKHANARANQIAQFEREIEFQIAGDLDLTVDRAVSLTGTGTQFDQVYFVDQLSHRFSVETGYAMECRARNKSQDVSVSDKDATGDETDSQTQQTATPDLKSQPGDNILENDQQ